jgi:hypothetical protein
MLKPGSSRRTISANIRRELRAGVPQRKAIAIALRNARQTARGKAKRRLARDFESWERRELALRARRSRLGRFSVHGRYVAKR